MTTWEENLYAGWKWEAINFLEWPVTEYSVGP